MTRSLLVLAALAAVALLVPTAAASAAPRFETTVTIDGFSSYPSWCNGSDCTWMIYGRVESPKAKCRNGRRVRLYGSAELEGPYSPRGYTFSDWRANWVYSSPENAPLWWYAKAPRKKLRSGAVCKADRSPINAPI